MIRYSLAKAFGTSARREKAENANQKLYARWIIEALRPGLNKAGYTLSHLDIEDNGDTSVILSAKDGGASKTFGFSCLCNETLRLLSRRSTALIVTAPDGEKSRPLYFGYSNYIGFSSIQFIGNGDQEWGRPDSFHSTQPGS